MGRGGPGHGYEQPPDEAFNDLDAWFAAHEWRSQPSECVCGAIMVEVAGDDGDVCVRCPNRDCEVYGKTTQKIYKGGRGGSPYVVDSLAVRQAMERERKRVRVGEERCPECGALMMENELLGVVVDCFTPECPRYAGEDRRRKVIIPGAHVPEFPTDPSNYSIWPTAEQWLEPCYGPTGGDHDWVMVALDGTGSRWYCRRCRQVEEIHA